MSELTSKSNEQIVKHYEGLNGLIVPEADRENEYFDDDIERYLDHLWEINENSGNIVRLDLLKESRKALVAKDGSNGDGFLFITRTEPHESLDYYTVHYGDGLYGFCNRNKVFWKNDWMPSMGKFAEVIKNYDFNGSNTHMIHDGHEYKNKAWQFAKELELKLRDSSTHQGIMDDPAWDGHL